MVSTTASGAPNSDGNSLPPVSRAVMLAAGVGQRLSPSGHTAPKSLLDIGGKTLLQRHFNALTTVGVKELSLCLGFEASQIEAAVACAPSSLSVSRCINPDYRRGSVVSLWTMREFLREPEPLLLMDADVLYSGEILRQLINAPQANCLAIDRDFVMGDEPVKVCIKEHKIVEFGKQLPSDLSYDTIAESVGFFKFSASMAQRVADRCEAYVNEGRLDDAYEEVIRELLLGYPEEFGVVDITGEPWIEIDFPEDIERARERILPQIS